MHRDFLIQPDSVPDALFPTNNDLDIPVLSLDYQADCVALPVRCWGQYKRTAANDGTWHFYTDDYRFQNLWVNPLPIVNTGCRAVVEPNFSINEQMPRAVALWRIYQKRWLSRYWQSHGIRVFADLNVAIEQAELNLLGIPQGYNAFATRGYVKWIEDIERQFETAQRIAGIIEPLFLVYGGGMRIKEMCHEKHWVWIPEEASAVRGRKDGQI